MLKKITKLTIVSATILPIIVATNQAYATILTMILSV